MIFSEDMNARLLGGNQYQLCDIVFMTESNW